MDERIDELERVATDALIRWIEDCPVADVDGSAMEWSDGKPVALDGLAAIAELRRHHATQTRTRPGVPDPVR